MVNILSSEQIKNILNLSERQVKALFKTKDFPVVQIGATYYVNETRFTEWLTQNEGQKVSLDYSKV